MISQIQNVNCLTGQMTQCRQQIKGMKIKKGVVEELLDSKRDLRNRTNTVCGLWILIQTNQL